MDGTGVPVVKKETAGRQGKTEGQPAHTREVKLGCVFTQATWDKQGYAIRDADSTTYTGAIETAEEFGKRLYREAWKRGWSRAKKRWSSAMAPNGSGILLPNTFRTPFRSSISTTLASTSLSGPASRRVLFHPCASLSLHVHHVVKRTYTSELSNLLGTQKKAAH
jgi:hypothetical protein